MVKKNNTKAKKRGNPSREMLYAEAAKYSTRAIEILVEIMEHGDNDNARMAAAKTILAKAIPDLKAIEITGEDNGPVVIRVIEDSKNNNNENE